MNISRKRMQELITLFRDVAHREAQIWQETYDPKIRDKTDEKLITLDAAEWESMSEGAADVLEIVIDLMNNGCASLGYKECENYCEGRDYTQEFFVKYMSLWRMYDAIEPYFPEISTLYIHNMKYEGVLEKFRTIEKLLYSMRGFRIIALRKKGNNEQ